MKKLLAGALVAALLVMGAFVAPGSAHTAAPARMQAPAIGRAHTSPGRVGGSFATTVGSVLTTTNGTWGNNPTSFSYQWEDCNTAGTSCTAITGATSQSYTLQSSDVGDTIVVVVTASNASGSATQASAPTAVVTASSSAAPTNTTAPAVTGTDQVGDTLTVTNGTWTGSPTFTYTWYDCYGSAQTDCFVNGGTSSTYTLAAADAGYTVDVVVTATNSSGSVTATAAQTSTVAAVTGAPVNSVVPVVSGTATQGDTLTTTDGTWTGSPTSYSIAWSDCPTSAEVGCTAISGATSTTYTLQSSDVGSYVRAVVTASNSTGAGAYAKSTTTAVIAAASGGGGGGSGATVADAPDGPATPSGGWTLEYGDAFGSPATALGGSDNTYFPTRDNNASTGCSATQGGMGAANEDDSFNCDQVSYGSSGMTLNCEWPGSGSTYVCGMASAEFSPANPSAYKLFSYKDPYGSSNIWVAQIQVQFPPSGTSDPAFWSYGPSGNDELDHFEGFGSGCPNSTECTTAQENWQASYITDPTYGAAGVGDGAGDSAETSGAELGFNPAGAVHTWTTEYNGATGLVTEYIDGVPQNWGYKASGSFPSSTTMTMGSHASADTEQWQVNNGARGPAADPWPGFSTAGSTYPMIVRSVAFYENTSANGSGASVTNGTAPLIAPGTTEASGVVSRREIAAVTRRGDQEHRRALIEDRRLHLSTRLPQAPSLAEFSYPAKTQRICNRRDLKLPGTPMRVVPCHATAAPVSGWVIALIVAGVVLLLTTIITLIVMFDSRKGA